MRATQGATARATAPDRRSDANAPQLLRNQMDATYFSCETLSWELNNRLNGDGTLRVYFDVNTIGLSIKLRSMYESLVLGDSLCLGDDAEQLMWRHCFAQFFDPISRKAAKIRPQHIRTAMEMLHVASNYYFGLIRKLAKLGSAEVAETVLSTPVALRWNNPKYEPRDAFVVEMVYRMYMHMGDIVRYRNVICPTVVYRAYPTAEKLYQYALSLKREDSAPFSRLGMLCSSVGRPIEAACYHLQGSRAKIQPDVSAQYFTLLLTENERHYYLATEKRRADNQREAEVNISEMFIYSSLRIVRYLWSATGKSQYCQLPAMVKENIRLLNGCFVQLQKRRFPGFVYRDINSDAILSLVAMQMALIELLEANGSEKRSIAEHWLLSVFRLVVQVMVHIVSDMYSRIPLPKGFKSTCELTNASAAPAAQSASLGGRKGGVSQPLATSQKVKKQVENGGHHDLAKETCIVVLRKLKALRHLTWMKVVKVICNWLQLHPDKLRKMSPDSWAQFALLANMLPTELELTDLYSCDKRLRKTVGRLFFTPLSEWAQEISLPEDVCTFDIIRQPLHQKISDKSMDDTSMCFLRICCLHKYAREFVRLNFTELKYDNWTMKYVAPSCSDDGSAKAPIKGLESVPENASVSDEPLKRRVSPYVHLDSCCRPTNFLIVDALSFCDKLAIMKELAHSNEFTIVICVSVLDQLREWKAGMQSAAKAISWIEYEWAHSNRALMIRTGDNCSEKWEGETSDPTMELVLMFGFLTFNPPYEVHQAILLTEFSRDSAEFKNIYTQAENKNVEEIDVRNLGEFYAQWTSKSTGVH
uniref:EST1 domain-containing protein n=1 Tax=Trichuris muris TaxID=70415 RepID=A0A5S6QDU1_TRIMR